MGFLCREAYPMHRAAIGPCGAILARSWAFPWRFEAMSTTGQILGGAVGAMVGIFSGGAATLSACVGGMAIGGQL